MDKPAKHPLDVELEAYIRHSISESPFYNFMGISLVELSEGRAIFAVASEKRHSNAIGLVQGGLMMSLADAAMGNAVRTLGVNGVTVDITGSYVKPAPFGGLLRAEGQIVKANRTLVYAQARVYCEDSLLVLAQGTFYIKESIRLGTA